MGAPHCKAGASLDCSLWDVEKKIIFRVESPKKEDGARKGKRVLYNLFHLVTAMMAGGKNMVCVAWLLLVLSNQETTNEEPRCNL